MPLFPDFALVTGVGSGGAGIPRVTISNDSNILTTQSGAWNLNNISGSVSLPTGAATSAKQDSANVSLASIDGKTPVLGQALAANSVPVVLTAAQLSTLTPLTSVTVTQAAAASLNTTAYQGDAWTVQPGNTQNTTPWLTQDSADGSVAPGAVAAKSQLGGGMYNSAGVLLTDAQQAALQMDSAGSLKVTVSGAILANPVAGASVVSTSNSTAAPLGANGVWTGTGELVADFASIVVYVDSNVASAANGLSIQFSSDNTNWNESKNYSYAASTGAHSYPEFPRAKYFRIVYTNGASAQAYFRLQTIHHYTAVTPKHTTLGTSLSQDEVAVLVRSLITGEDPFSAGTYRNLKVNSNGQLLVAIAGALAPTSAGATESANKRAYQTTYTYSAINSGTEYPVLYIRNPLGSGKTTFIRYITTGNTTGASKSITLRVYANPTVTANGTAVASPSMYVGGGALAPTTLATSVPTVTSNGTVLSQIVCTNEQGSLDYDWGLLIAPNNSLLITVTGSANNQTVDTNIIWTEA